MFEQGRASLDLSATLRKALCPNGDTVVVARSSMHVAAWAKKFLFAAEQLEVPVGDLSGGEQARVRIAQLMLQPADLLLLDEPANDLDIPALEVLEDSLAEFAGALVLVSHDRDLMGRLCTEFVGLDGRGGAAIYGSVEQWLSAYEKRQDSEVRGQGSGVGGQGSAVKEPALRATKKGKLSYREQQEFDQMEAAIVAAELAVAERRPRWKAPPQRGTSPWPMLAGLSKTPSASLRGFSHAGRNSRQNDSHEDKKPEFGRAASASLGM